VINASPRGHQSGGHGHADALSICLHAQGHALLVDPGTFEYVGDGPERDSFRSTAMHNTLRMDGVSQSEPAGPFAWKQFTPAKADQWITGETFALFVGSHDCYSRLPSAVVHRRWIFALKSGPFLVRDCACGSGKHRLDISWHLGPEMRLQGERLFGLKDTSGGLAVVCVDKHGWSEEVRKDMWSPVYGKKEPITVLNFGTVTALPAEFVTLLVPLEEVHGIPGKLVRIAAQGPGTPVKAYLYGSPSEECSFFFAEAGRSWTQGKLASDAEFVCWQRQREGDEQLLVFCNGSYVEIEGRRVLDCKRQISHCEMLSCDGRKEVHASDPEALLEQHLGSNSRSTGSI
jgi:hypothetical protein